MLQHLLRAGFVRSLRETPLQRFHSIIIVEQKAAGLESFHSKSFAK
jgi:hypothetical protein